MQRDMAWGAFLPAFCTTFFHISFYKYTFYLSSVKLSAWIFLLI